MIIDIDTGQEFILQPCVNAQKIKIILLQEDSVRLSMEEMPGLVQEITEPDAVRLKIQTELDNKYPTHQDLLEGATDLLLIIRALEVAIKDIGKECDADG